MVNNWLVLELSEYADKANYQDIQNSLLYHFGEVEHFIPIHFEKLGSYESTSVLFEGYAFVRDSSSVREKIHTIRESGLFTGVLTDVQGKFQLVKSSTIGVLKRKLKRSLKKKIQIGSVVKIKDGVFKNLEGEVMGLDDCGKKVVVKVSRYSREMIAPMPSSSVEEIHEASDN